MRIFVCSPYAGDVAGNVARARRYTQQVIAQGHAPFAPHLLYPQCLDDDDPQQREAGIACGLAFLRVCDEVWVFGSNITAGMRVEIECARQSGIPVIYRNG